MNDNRNNKMDGNQTHNRHQMDEENNDHRVGHANYRQERTPWYNRGWVWMIIIGLVLLFLVMGYSWIADELGNIGQSIEEQTEAIREQTGVIEEQNTILQNIRDSMNQILIAIRDAINRILGASTEQ